MKLQLEQIVHSDQSPYNIEKIERLMHNMLHFGFDETKPILVRPRSRRRSSVYKKSRTPRWEIFDGIHRYIALFNIQQYYCTAFDLIVPEGIPVREV